MITTKHAKRWGNASCGARNDGDYDVACPCGWSRRVAWREPGGYLPYAPRTMTQELQRIIAEHENTPYTWELHELAEITADDTWKWGAVCEAITAMAVEDLEAFAMLLECELGLMPPAALGRLGEVQRLAWFRLDALVGRRP